MQSIFKFLIMFFSFSLFGYSNTVKIYSSADGEAKNTYLKVSSSQISSHLVTIEKCFISVDLQNSQGNHQNRQEKLDSEKCISFIEGRPEFSLEELIELKNYYEYRGFQAIGLDVLVGVAGFVIGSFTWKLSLNLIHLSKFAREFFSSLVVFLNISWKEFYFGGSIVAGLSSGGSMSVLAAKLNDLFNPKTNWNKEKFIDNILKNINKGETITITKISFEEMKSSLLKK